MFGLFEKKRVKISDHDMIILMPPEKAYFADIVCDDDIPRDVYRVSGVEVTIRRQSVERKLVRCRDTVKTIVANLKKHQAVVYYIASKWFEIDLKEVDGSTVRCSARFNITPDTSAGLADWLELNVKKAGDPISVEKVASLLSGRTKPDWLEVKDAVLIAEPEPAAPVEPINTGSAHETVESLSEGSRLFERWEIIRELGQGGMGKVYLAKDLMTPLEEHSKVVIKVMHIEAAHDPYAINQFVKEAKVLKSLRHKYIATLEDCLMLGDTPIIVMEYIEGESMSSYLSSHDMVLDEKMTKELLLPMAQALDYAHSERIFHLDVKPQNIMVRKTMKSGARTCLLDFGIARKAHADGSMTFTMSVAGTPLYMSQEQRNGEPANAAMDVFALAVTAYECLTGKMPYPCGQTMSHSVEPLPFDTPFAKSIMRGLDINPVNRPRSCVELIDPPGVEVVTPPVRPRVETLRVRPTTSVSQASKKKVEKEVEASAPLRDCQSEQFKEIIKSYRALLSRSAKRQMNSDPELAGRLKNSQARLRRLTEEPSTLDPMAFAEAFVEIQNYLAERGVKPEDVFYPYSDLNELRLKVEHCPNALAWDAIMASLK